MDKNSSLHFKELDMASQRGQKHAYNLRVTTQRKEHRLKNGSARSFGSSAGGSGSSSGFSGSAGGAGVAGGSGSTSGFSGSAGGGGGASGSGSARSFGQNNSFEIQSPDNSFTNSQYVVGGVGGAHDISASNSFTNSQYVVGGGGKYI